jgi:outer membrane biosynthesis protein TonB
LDGATGVSVSGGNSEVSLPSFGSTASPPSSGGRSRSPDENKGPGITIVGTSRSGGAFNFYGALKGDRVYTIYIDTSAGPAVMQFADPSSASHPYAEDLLAPQPLRAELPGSLVLSRLVIACILDRNGSLRNAQVLEPATAEVTRKVMAALPSWKFSPALRGNQPVEVNAILGFSIDTR